MVNTRTVFIGVAGSPTQWTTGGWTQALNAVIAQIEDNDLDVLINQYYVLTPEQTADAAATFLEQTKYYARRAFIAASGSADLIAAEAVCRSSRVPCFSVGASATSIIESTTHALSYAPLDRNAVMFLFVMHFLYARTHLFIIYDHNDTAREIFINSYIDDVRRQAAVFGTTVCTQTLDSTDELPDDSTILMLASNTSIATAGAVRMNCPTPDSSIVYLTDINSGARDSYFGANVIPLCIMMYALDYTTQTRAITALFTKTQLQTISPYVYALFDCLLTLAKFSLTSVSLTTSNFVTFNVVLPSSSSSTSTSAAYMPNKYLCTRIRSPCFCRYSICFIRQQFLADPALYLTRFRGGTPLFPDSYVSLYQFGFMRNATSFVLEQNRFLRMNEPLPTSALVMEKFDVVDVNLGPSSSAPLLPPVQTSQTLLLGVELERDAVTNVPTQINRLQVYSGSIPPSQTMGKVLEQYEVLPSCRA